MGVSLPNARAPTAKKYWSGKRDKYPNRKSLINKSFIASHPVGWTRLWTNQALNHTTSRNTLRKTSRDTLQNPSRRVHLRTRAVCFVANPRNSFGYSEDLRLAFHPDPRAARFPRGFCRVSLAQGR